MNAPSTDPDFIAEFRHRYGRGLLWLAIALVGALVIGKLPAWGVDDYTARWAGAMFKAAAGAWGGYRISKGICRIDPSQAQTDVGAALLHLARAVIVTGTIASVCLAV